MAIWPAPAADRRTVRTPGTVAGSDLAALSAFQVTVRTALVIVVPSTTTGFGSAASVVLTVQPGTGLLLTERKGLSFGSVASTATVPAVSDSFGTRKVRTAYPPAVASSASTWTCAPAGRAPASSRPPARAAAAAARASRRSGRLWSFRCSLSGQHSDVDVVRPAEPGSLSRVSPSTGGPRGEVATGRSAPSRTRTGSGRSGAGPTYPQGGGPGRRPRRRDPISATTSARRGPATKRWPGSRRGGRRASADRRTGPRRSGPRRPGPVPGPRQTAGHRRGMTRPADSAQAAGAGHRGRVEHHVQHRLLDPEHGHQDAEAGAVRGQRDRSRGRPGMRRPPARRPTAVGRRRPGARPSPAARKHRRARPSVSADAWPRPIEGQQGPRRNVP